MTDSEFWLLLRQALLLMVDAIERRLALTRTAELRRERKRQSREEC
jgi:hypothetical protein